MESKVLFLFTIISLFFLCFVNLSKCVTLSDGGYFVKLLELPAVCPLASFCIPWRPVPSENADDRQVHLLRTPDLILSLSGMHLPAPRGRLKSTYRCASSLRGKKAKGIENWRGAWCVLEPSSGEVTCHGEGNKAPRYKSGRASRHVYLVPKSCVSWKSNYKTQRVYTRAVSATVINNNSNNNNNESIIEIEFNNYGVRMTNTQKDSEEKSRRFVRWSSPGTEVAFINAGVVVSVGKSVASVDVENVTSFRVARESSSYANRHLELLVDYLNPEWVAKVNLEYPLITQNATDVGIMWSAGLLEAIQWTPTTRINGSMTGLCPHRFSNPYCECRYLRQETAPKTNSTPDTPSSTWWQDIPLPLRTQSCCDLLLGKLNRTMTEEEYQDQGGPQFFYPGRFLYLSDQLPCPRGARLLESDGTCLKLPCCDRTRLQVAQWDYKVRGRCWVLRSHSLSNSANGTGLADNTTMRVSVSAAYGIIGLTTVFVLSFRFVTRRLDECRRKTGRLPAS